MLIPNNTKQSQLAFLFTGVFGLVLFISVFNQNHNPDQTGLINQSIHIQDDQPATESSKDIFSDPFTEEKQPENTSVTTEPKVKPDMISDPDANKQPQDSTTEVPVKTTTSPLPVHQAVLAKKYSKEKALDRECANVFLEKGGVIEKRDPRRLLLCRLSSSNQCRSLYPSDVIDTFYVFLPIYAENQQQQENLYIHHQNFVYFMKSLNIHTVVLEAIYSGQNYLVTKAGNEPWEIQLKVDDTFYYRENFLNVAIRKTSGWEYALWIDAHQIFLNTYWWEEGIIKMEHYNNVQFFQTLAWLDQLSNATDPVQNLHSVQYAYTTTKDLNRYIFPPTNMWNGNAVGIRREIYEGIEYILDECIAGCCDCAFNVAGMKDHWDRVDRFPNYAKQLNPWIEKASRVFDGKVAIVRGRMYHFHHDHFFNWERYLNGLGFGNYDLANDLERDNNFTLHIKPGSRLSTLFNKHW